MAISPITGGVIKHGRTIKTGDFESKRADVELSFNVAEGEDHDNVITHVRNIAATHLGGILGTVEHNAPAAAKPAGKKAATKMPAANADAAAVTDDPLADTAPVAQNKKAAEADPAAMAEDDLDFLGTEPAAKEITDKELNDAAQKCQSENKNGPAIRKLINDCGVKSPPGRLIDIEQGKRQSFLDGLKKIKPLA